MVKDTIAVSDSATPRTAGKALGTTAKYASTGSESGAEQHRLSRWSDQNVARQLKPFERVARCQRQIQALHSGVTVFYVPATQSAHYGGLETCGSVWMCPICAAKITERRRVELQAAIAQARRLGLRVVMATYTFSHRRGDDLAEMVGDLQLAFKRYHSGRPSRRRRERFGIVGTVRALEVTYSDENGWHVHIHELIFLDAGADIEALAGESRTAWERAAAAEGLSMNQHGYRLDDCDARIADYIAKYGHEPAWQEDAELTKWHVKKSHNSQRRRDEHVTPFGLLRYAGLGDEHAGVLFQEYAGVFKGLRQLHWSPGLRELLQIGEEKTDEDLAQEQEEQAISLAMIGRGGWCVVVGNDARGELLEVARNGNPDELHDFLTALGLRQDEHGCYQNAARIRRAA